MWRPLAAVVPLGYGTLSGGSCEGVLRRKMKQQVRKETRGADPLPGLVADQECHVTSLVCVAECGAGGGEVLWL